MDGAACSRVSRVLNHTSHVPVGCGGGALPALVRVIKLVIRLKTYLFDFRFTFVNGQWTMRDERTFLSSKVTGKLRRASDLTLSLTFLQSLSSLTRCLEKECTKVVFTSFVVSVCMCRTSNEHVTDVLH